MRALMRRWITVIAISMAATVVFGQSAPPLVAQSPVVAAHAITVDQIRELFRLTHMDEEYRVRWMASLERNRSKGEPYWPESFWADAREEMRRADLAPVVYNVYKSHVDRETMDSVNKALHSVSLAEFASTPLGEHFCAMQKSTKEEGMAATLDMTQALLERVYQRHKTEIKAARAKYLLAHPDWKD